MCENSLSDKIGKGKKLFRPPYGRMSKKQSHSIINDGYEIIMWDILTADFDQSITPEQCLKNVLANVTSGSIIIFHDSVKAFTNLKYALPETLKFLNEKGFRCKAL